MSSFNTGRRGQTVNMSQYLQNLNEIRQEPSPEDTTASLDDELAVFANTNFVDWDAPSATHTSPATHIPTTTGPPVSASTPMTKQAATPAPPPNTDPLADLTTFDFNLDGYGFDFNPYTSSGVPAFSENLSALQPLQPAPTYSTPGTQQRGHFVPAGPSAGEKRKAETVPAPRQMSFEEQSRLAAEEDKRRRNTAASARFRVKKKAREQALEKSQKEYAEKIVLLEGRISTLETENKWLRELVMEKNGGNADVVSNLLDNQKAKEAASKADSTTAKSS